MPTVSIGMPVYNGEAFVREAIASLLAQTFTDFELIVSDNGSTDNTQAICREFAKSDPRVVFHQQAQNIGPARNFAFVQKQATGRYYMWAACDDRWGERFLELCVAHLDANPASVGVITNARFGAAEGVATGTDPIVSNSVHTRRRRFLANPGPNARFYSLLRRSALEDLGFERYDFHAGDWAFIFDLLAKGELHRIPDYCGFFKRASGYGSDTQGTAKRLRSSKVPRLFPLKHLVGYILTRHRAAGWLHLPALLRMNVKNYLYIYHSR